MIGVLISVIVLSLRVDAQSTVDGSASCESSALYEAVDVIREELKDVRLIRADLSGVKSACASCQQQQQQQQQSCTVDASSAICTYAVELYNKLFVFSFLRQLTTWHCPHSDSLLH